MKEVLFDIYPCKNFPDGLWTISSDVLYKELFKINKQIVDDYFDKVLHWDWDYSLGIDQVQQRISKWVSENVKSKIFDTSSLIFTKTGQPSLRIRFTKLRVAFGFLEE